jgi:hypothetical protein
VNQTLAKALAPDFVEPRLAIRPVDVRELQSGNGNLEVLFVKAL